MGKTTKHSPPAKGSFLEATHYLISPSNENIPLYQTSDSTNIPVKEVGDDFKIKVIEANLGDKYQLAKIQDESGAEYFVESLYAQPFEDTDVGEFMATLQDSASTAISSDFETPLKDLDLNKPHFENDKYSIALDSGTTLKSEFEGSIRDMKKKGLEALLQHYGKVMDNVDSFVDNPFNLMQVSEPYFPTRPGQNIKAKISVYKKYFESLESLSFDEFAIQNIHKNFIATTFPANKIESEIRNISKILDKYASDINSFEGTLENLDFKKLSTGSLKFFSDFKTFLSENNISLDNLADSKFEFGFDRDTFRLDYVLLFDPYGKFLNIGIPNFSNKINTKMSKLLIAHKDVLSSSASGMGWMDFCKKYLAGEFSILFSKASDIASLGKIPTSTMQKEFDLTKVSLDKLSFMTADQAFGIASLVSNPEFRTRASDLLMNSRDLIGDNFLINLPDILNNIEDLSSLYQLVFDKVSIKDLTDIMMEKFSEEMDLADFNEMKLRGILKTLRIPEMIEIIYDILSISEISDLNEVICKIYKFAPDEMDTFLNKFISVENINLYLLYYDEDGNIAGMLPETLPAEGTDLLLAELENNNIRDCAEFAAAIYSENYQIKDYIDGASAAAIFCRIMSEGFPSYTNPCPELGVTSLPRFSIGDLKMDIIDGVKSLKKDKIALAIDTYMKELFKVELPPGTLNIYQRFLTIPKIKLELDKLTLTKQKLLSKAPGLDVDLEAKRADVNFTLPSIKKVNPSFDFAKFEFGNIDDIFGGAMSSIEGAIIQGIEKGLVGAFKGMLNNVLKSLNLDTPSLRDPDFGALSMNDLLDASPGASAENVAGLALPKFQNAIGRFDPNFYDGDPLFDNPFEFGELDEGDTGSPSFGKFDPNIQDIMDMFDDMSDATKPLELTRIMKGQSNAADYKNMRANIKNPKMKAVLSEDLFGDIMETVSDYADITILEELEDASAQGETIISFCENSGIPYKMGKVKDMLKDKYSDLTDEEVDEVIENIVEEAKDSVVDAIGNMKEDFNDSLPFDEDPCSFMPKPSDIPALNYVNDMTFDAIFDAIELEYKAECASFPDMMMLPVESDTYVKLYYNSTDSILDPENPPIPDQLTGLYELVYVSVGEDNVYNQDFGNHYYGKNTPLYKKEDGKYVKLDKDSSGYPELTKNDLDEWREADDKQVYIKKLEQNLAPLPGLRDYMRDPTYSLVYEDSIYKIDFVDTGVKISITPEALSTTYSMPREGTVDCVEPIPVSSANSGVSFQTFRDKVLDRVTSIAYESLGTTDSYAYTNYRNIGLHNFVANAVELEAPYDPSKSQTLYRNSGGAFAPPQPDFAHLFVSSTLQEIMKDIGTTELFDVNYMQTFLLEADDVDLMRIQESKGSAKDEFNEKCSFTDEGLSKLASSSIKKLVYLTVRIHMIDVIARGCFLYDSIIEDEPTAALKTLTFESMNSELLSYDNNYHDLFVKKYSEEYGAEFANNEAFAKLFDEIYNDMSQYFKPVLFKNSKVSVFKLLKDATSVFHGSAAMVPHHCEQIIKEEKYPFTIQKLIRLSNGKEILWDDPDAETHKHPGTEYILRLCYVHKCAASHLSTISEYKTVNLTAPALGKIKEYTIRDDEEKFQEYVSVGLAQDYADTTELGVDYNNTESVKIRKTYESVSYIYDVRWKTDGPTVQTSDIHQYVLIPVAETVRVFQTSEERTSDSPMFDDGTVRTEDVTPTIKADAFKNSDYADPYDLYSFYKDVIPTDLLYTAFLMIVHSKALREKPSIFLSFEKTKITIRRAIESLSQDPDKFDFEENETKNDQLEQSQGVGTNPEFSANAAKMALMTVPMIIKGFAEMFDPNTMVASKVRMGADMAGFNIPPPMASMMCLPMNLVPGFPGPPITPLGLLYLATSFLEPKERKKLSDIRKGKKMNPGADQETGSFVGGTVEEQEAAQQDRQESIDAAIITNFEKIEENITECLKEIAIRLTELRDKAQGWEDDSINPDAPWIEFPDDFDDGHLRVTIDNGSYEFKTSLVTSNQMIKSNAFVPATLNTIIDSYAGNIGAIPYHSSDISKLSIFYHIVGLFSPDNFSVSTSSSVLANTFALLNWMRIIPLETNSGASVKRFLNEHKFVYSRQFAYHTERAQYVIQRLLALCLHNVLKILRQDIPSAIEQYSFRPNFRQDYSAAASYFQEVIVYEYLKYLTSSADSTGDYQNLQNAAISRRDKILSATGEHLLRAQINQIVQSNILLPETVTEILTENQADPFGLEDLTTRTETAIDEGVSSMLLGEEDDSTGTLTTATATFAGTAVSGTTTSSSSSSIVSTPTDRERMKTMYLEEYDRYFTAYNNTVDWSWSKVRRNAMSDAQRDVRRHSSFDHVPKMLTHFNVNDEDGKFVFYYPPNSSNGNY